MVGLNGFGRNERSFASEGEIPLLEDSTDESIRQLQGSIPNSTSVKVQINSAPLDDPFDAYTLHDVLGKESDRLSECDSKGWTSLTSARMDDQLMDPRELYSYITQSLSSMPPRIYMRVRGCHQAATQGDSSRSSTNSQRNDAVVDFDFVVSMRGFLGQHNDPTWHTCSVASDHIRTYRGTLTETTGQGEEYPSFQQFATENEGIFRRFTNPWHYLMRWRRRLRSGEPSQASSWNFPASSPVGSKASTNWSLFNSLALLETSLEDHPDWRSHNSGAKRHDGGSSRPTIFLSTTSEHPSGYERSLLEWCEDYCNYKTPRKAFRITRKINGLDIAALRTHVTALLYSHHVGRIEIGFTTVDERIDIYPPGSLHQIVAEQRAIHACFKTFGFIAIGLIGICSVAFVFVTCILLLHIGLAIGEVQEWAVVAHGAFLYFRTFLTLICASVAIGVLATLIRRWVNAHFGVRKWAIYNVDWTVWQWDGSQGQQRVKRYAGLNEAQWVQTHAQFLCRLVMNKFQGDATDLMDILVPSI
jgi:hypothetical protein